MFGEWVSLPESSVGRGPPVGHRLSRQVSSKFTEIPPADESFDLVLQLDALLGVVAVASMKSTVLPTVEAFCL